ncbi:MAG TPA: hypothetical protein VHN99_04610 [Deinococcales bacterium]|nr:hypothetical protein [Deinococcales bacterium]
MGGAGIQDRAVEARKKVTKEFLERARRHVRRTLLIGDADIQGGQVELTVLNEGNDDLIALLLIYSRYEVNVHSRPFRIIRNEVRGDNLVAFYFGLAEGENQAPPD